MQVPQLGSVNVQLVKLSQIKVREYGSRFMVDKHEDRSQRWDKLELHKRISELWSANTLANASVPTRALMFIGFDIAPEPFRRELGALHEQLDASGHGAVYVTRYWQDIYKRGFGVRLAAWLHTTK